MRSDWQPLEGICMRAVAYVLTISRISLSSAITHAIAIPFTAIVKVLYFKNRGTDCVIHLADCGNARAQAENRRSLAVH